MKSEHRKMFYLSFAMTQLWAVATILAEYPSWVFCIIMSVLWATMMVATR